MVAAGTGLEVAITLYVIGEGRWEAQNFPNAVLDPAALTWTSTRPRVRLTPRSATGPHGDERRQDVEQRVRPAGSLLLSQDTSSGQGLTITVGASSYATFAEAYVRQGVANGEATTTDCLTGLAGIAGSKEQVSSGYCPEPGRDRPRRGTVDRGRAPVRRPPARSTPVCSRAAVWTTSPSPSWASTRKTSGSRGSRRTSRGPRWRPTCFCSPRRSRRRSAASSRSRTPRATPALRPRAPSGRAAPLERNRLASGRRRRHRPHGPRPAPASRCALRRSSGPRVRSRPRGRGDVRRRGALLALATGALLLTRGARADEVQDHQPRREPRAGRTLPGSPRRAGGRTLAAEVPAARVTDRQGVHHSGYDAGAAVSFYQSFLAADAGGDGALRRDAEEQVQRLLPLTRPSPRPPVAPEGVPVDFEAYGHGDRYTVSTGEVSCATPRLHLRPGPWRSGSVGRSRSRSTSSLDQAACAWRRRGPGC